MLKKKRNIKKEKLKNASPKELHQMVQNGDIDMVDVVQLHFPRMSRKELEKKVVINL